MARFSFFSALVLLAVIPALVNSQADAGRGRCRCFPGDPCWPSPAEWRLFNRTVSGRLVPTVPIGNVCHNSAFGTYDAAKCAQLQAEWGLPETHFETSSSVMAYFFANMSCDPFTAPSAQCVIGTYVQYAVDARSARDYLAAIAFAQARNIRLVIRNTGHDYLGKSTGAGALAIWTHNIKDIDVINYASPGFTGKALKIGAGVQVFEAVEAAHAAGLVIVGGNCPTVGIAGGFTQGGGLGPLSTRHGLSADQVLEWDVVTAEGRRVVATPTRNRDLYWALSGGGGSTYGAVLSVTLKAYPDVQVAGANLTFTSQGVTPDVFFGAVQTFLTTLPAIVDAGAVSIWLLGPNFFLMQPTTAPGKTVPQLQALIDPTLAKLNQSGIPYSYFIGGFPTYLDSYRAMNPEPMITAFNIGGRLMPRSLTTSNSSAATLMSALRFIVENGGVVSGVSFNVSRFGGGNANAVLPVWRSSIISIVMGVPYNNLDLSANVAAQALITDVFQPRLEAISPGGGSYLNEADFHQPNFQQAFYGPNYPALKAIKRKYDPLDTFYGLTAVGSEDWKVQPDGRLCRV